MTDSYLRALRSLECPVLRPDAVPVFGAEPMLNDGVPAAGGVGDKNDELFAVPPAAPKVGTLPVTESHTLKIK